MYTHQRLETEDQGWELQTLTPPLQWPAHSNRLAVLACVHCQGGPLSSRPLIGPTHLKVLCATISEVVQSISQYADNNSEQKDGC